MKSGFSFAMTVVGTLIGAGFATGQELYSFFVLRGGNSYIYFFISVMIMLISSLIIYIYARNNKIKNLNMLFSKLLNRWGASVSTFIITLFLFCCFSITSSGAGVLFEENMNLPYYFGVITILVVTFSAMQFNINGVFFVNSLLTPVIILCILIFTLLSSISGKDVFLNTGSRFVLPLWYALLYFGYNILSLLPITVSSCENAGRKSIINGFVSAFFVLLITGISMLVIMNNSLSQLENSNLPILDMFKDYSEICGNIYIIIMYFAMITTAVSCFYGFLENISSYVNIPHNFITVIGLIISFFITGFGFTGLVRKLYSFFGLMGIIIMFCSICKILLFFKQDFSKKIIKKL